MESFTRRMAGAQGALCRPRELYTPSHAAYDRRRSPFIDTHKHIATWGAVTGGTTLWPDTRGAILMKSCRSLLALVLVAVGCSDVYVPPPRDPAVRSPACGAPRRLCGAFPVMSCVDVAVDRANCGSCGRVCVAGPRAGSACVVGSCRLLCDAGYADCDSIPTNGCEVDQRYDPANCGRCGGMCIVANGTATCNGGRCGVAACNIGFADCDRDPTNGCEVNVTDSPAHCGRCGAPCEPTQWCRNGVCRSISGTWWTTVGGLNFPRYLHTATLLDDGRVLIAGGETAPGRVLQSAEIYDPAIERFHRVGDLMNARRFHTAERMPDGTVLLIGGDDGNQAWQNAELYTPGNSAFITIPGAHGLAAPGTSQLSGGDILVTGGHRTGLGGGFCSGATTRISLRNGRIISSSAGGYPYTWTAPGSLSMPVFVGGHGQVTMASGSVLMAGGWCSGWSMHSSVWENAATYDPSTSTWAQVGPMSAQRHRFTLTALRSGNVLVAGGFDANSALRSTELFQASVRRFTAGPDMAVQRAFHQAVRLDPARSGYVLICGGEDDRGVSHGVTELYGEATARMVRMPDMLRARSQHTATRLADGRILVVGGRDATGALSTAELFTPGP